MRYRPLSRDGMSISAVSLSLDDQAPTRSAADWAAFVHAAMESGINGFEVAGRSPAMIDGLAQALRGVDRRLLFVSWRICPNTMPVHFADRAMTAGAIDSLVRAVISRTGLEYLDLVVLDDPGGHDLSPTALQTLKDLRAKGSVRQIGVAGQSDIIDAYISSRQFDILAMPFNILSGGRERQRIKACTERNMAVIGYDPYPEALHPKARAAIKRGLLSWGRRSEPGKAESFAFLEGAKGWSPEEISLAFALTETGLASVQIRADKVAHMQEMASVAERAMPPGLAAQIEMSRFVGQDERRA